MTLEFVIIPVTNMFKNLAYELQEILHESVGRNLCVKLDEEYDSQMHSRIKYWQDNEYNIITIGASYIEDKIISVRFNDKRTKPENMNIDDFIDLLNSFEDDTPSDDSEKENSFCIIM